MFRRAHFNVFGGAAFHCFLVFLYIKKELKDACIHKSIKCLSFTEVHQDTESCHLSKRVLNNTKRDHERINSNKSICVITRFNELKNNILASLSKENIILNRDCA